MYGLGFNPPDAAPALEAPTEGVVQELRSFAEFVLPIVSLLALVTVGWRVAR